MDDTKKLSRREFVTLGGLWAVNVTVVTLAAAPRTASAKAVREVFHYQEKPNDGKSCSSCNLFSLLPDGKGSCAIIEGVIVPNGWCMAYTPRSNK